MNTDSVIVHSAALSNAVFRKSFGEGSSVFIRVLKNNGGDSYTVSFGGGRFTIRSELPLEEGSSFRATVRLDGDTVFLVRQNDGAVSGGALYNEIVRFDDAGTILNPAVAAYFKKLGLVPDGISFALFEQMKLLGRKFDAAAFARARALSKKFKGTEKDAANTSLIMEEKGIRARKDDIRAVLGGGGSSGGENAHSSFSQNQQEDNRFSEKNGFSDGSGFPGAQDFKHFFDGLLRVGTEKTPGILALFNHTGFSRDVCGSFGSWIRVPFEFDMKSAGKKISGSISLFLNPQEKSVGRCVLKCAAFQTEYGFVLFFEGGKCVRIKTPFSNCFPPDFYIPVEKCGADEISEFYADDGALILTGGFV